MHARSADANQPDWLTRRITDIRQSDLKYTEQWAYDRSLKPNAFNVQGIHEPPVYLETYPLPWFFMRELDTRKPQRISGDLPPVRYGQSTARRHAMPFRPETMHSSINSHQI